MLKSAVIEERKLKHSPWAAADNPLGPKFWCQQEGLITMVICLKRISLISDLIHIFSWFDKCILAVGQGQTIRGDKILMSIETSYHFGHLLQVQKKSLWSLILYNFFFHDFIHVYSPGAGADKPLGMKFWCQQEHLVTLVICCKFKKNLWSLILYKIFHDSIHVYSPGQGHTARRGLNFDDNRKPLSLCPFVARFKEISLKSDFIHFFMI